MNRLEIWYVPSWIPMRDVNNSVANRVKVVAIFFWWQGNTSNKIRLSTFNNNCNLLITKLRYIKHLPANNKRKEVKEIKAVYKNYYRFLETILKWDWTLISWVFDSKNSYLAHLFVSPLHLIRTIPKITVTWFLEWGWSCSQVN